MLPVGSTVDRSALVCKAGTVPMSISWCRRRLTSGRRQHGKERRASPRQPFELRDENLKFQEELTIAEHRYLRVNQPSARNPTAHLELIPALAGSWQQMEGGALVGRRGASGRPYSTARPGPSSCRRRRCPFRARPCGRSRHRADIGPTSGGGLDFFFPVRAGQELRHVLVRHRRVVGAEHEHHAPLGCP